MNNPHGIENYSTVPNTINQMLCMGHQNVLRVFPVWPRNLDAHFTKLRIEGAFLVTSELNNGLISFVHIISEKGRTLTVENPWPNKSIRIQQNGFSKIRQGHRLVIETTSGDQLILTPLD